MLNGILWLARTGAQWRQLPERYGPWQSVYARFAKWRSEGLWEEILHALSLEIGTQSQGIGSGGIQVRETDADGGG